MTKDLRPRNADTLPAPASCPSCDALKARVDELTETLTALATKVDKIDEATDEELEDLDVKIEQVKEELQDDVRRIGHRLEADLESVKDDVYRLQQAERGR